MTTKTDIEGPRPEAAAILSRVARRVRDRRASLQWTAKELASRSGISPRFVSDLEAGRGNISIGRLASVALALGVDVGRLVEEEPRPEVPDGPRIVALLGLRGAGKTTLGQRLAAALGVRFVELDDAIEDAAGLSLAEISLSTGRATTDGWRRRRSPGFWRGSSPSLSRAREGSFRTSGPSTSCEHGVAPSGCKPPPWTT